MKLSNFVFLFRFCFGSFFDLRNYKWQDCSEKAKICSDYTKINEKVNRFGTRQNDGVYWLAPRSSCLDATPFERYFITQCVVCYTSYCSFSDDDKFNKSLSCASYISSDEGQQMIGSESEPRTLKLAPPVGKPSIQKRGHWWI
ncbi:Oidioi.mRNA.OKI2018_I69.chr1.g195.t1.cds [Oikopleura dioica]|uniref:Oidioi.mRNA.OKI2018_I69.chr1.g195.t1.cds n=1 Tax=Oikopleura dioica TaxID=34765 RepID=A0ABN7SMY3_OIKDI|nr:Oidioi.mRNA.OKI2018_I69.chr1.g195.t1.cds [Oikopleura dioica]